MELTKEMKDLLRRVAEDAYRSGWNAGVRAELKEWEEETGGGWLPMEYPLPENGCSDEWL